MVVFRQENVLAAMDWSTVLCIVPYCVQDQKTFTSGLRVQTLGSGRTQDSELIIIIPPLYELKEHKSWTLIVFSLSRIMEDITCGLPQLTALSDVINLWYSGVTTTLLIRLSWSNLHYLRTPLIMWFTAIKNSHHSHSHEKCQSGKFISWIRWQIANCMPRTQ